MWHSFLDPENVFVEPEDPVKVTAIIEWQGTEIAPLIAHNIKPEFINHEGPQATSLEEPRLPENFEQLPESEQKQVQDLWTRQSLVFLYNTLMSKSSSAIWQSLQFQETPEYLFLLFARMILLEGEAPYRKMVFDFLDSHPKVAEGGNAAGSEPRDRLFALIQERESIENDYDGAYDGVAPMKSIKKIYGRPVPRTWVG